MKIDVLAIGELLADLISSEYVNDLSETKSFEIFQGGSPANLCANLKWLGKNVELSACVGDDSVGDFLIQNLGKVGLSSEYISKSTEFPSSLVLVGKSKSSPDFIAYRMADSRISTISAGLIKESKILHTSAFALSKEPARNHILLAFKSAFALGREISCDWNFAPQIWQDDNGMKVFEDLCSMRPLLKMSLDDFQRFIGSDLADEKMAMEFLSQYKTKVACLTCGADGVWFTDEAGAWHKLDAEPVSEVRDTTGAGDAFWAGFLNARLEGKSNEESVRGGIAVAARKIQKFGPLYL